MSKELKTMSDLQEFLKKCEEQIKRLHAADDTNHKLKILRSTYEHFNKYYTTSNEQLEKQPGDNLPEGLVAKICKDIEDEYSPYGGAKYICKTLGTHRNWFKWVLSFMFSAPKSKQFIDEYGLFKQSRNNIDTSTQCTIDEEESPQDSLGLLLAKNISKRSDELRFKSSSLSDHEMHDLTKFMASNRTILDIVIGFPVRNLKEGEQFKKYTDRNKFLSLYLPSIEQALQQQTLDEVIVALEKQPTNYKDRSSFSLSYSQELGYFFNKYYFPNKKKWGFTEEELTPEEHNRLADAINLYRAAYKINEGNFHAAHKFFSVTRTDLGKQIKENLHNAMFQKIQSFTNKELARKILSDLKADLTQPNNRQILNNAQACQLIKFFTMSGIPIEYDYFDSLPHVTEAVFVIFQGMQEQNCLNVDSTNKIFKILDAMQLSSASTHENPEDLIAKSFLPEDITTSLLEIVKTENSRNPQFGVF